MTDAFPVDRSTSAFSRYLAEVPRTAAHEAGHVVAALSEGRYPHRIVLEPDPEGQSLSTVFVQPSTAEIIAHTNCLPDNLDVLKLVTFDARQHATYCVAGMAAEVVLGLTLREDALRFAEDDLASARQILTHFFPEQVEDELADAESRAITMFEKPAVRSLLTQIADELESLIRQGEAEVDIDPFTEQLEEWARHVGEGFGTPTSVDLR